MRCGFGINRSLSTCVCERETKRRIRRERGGGVYVMESFGLRGYQMTGGN